ncbi:hypothetical protein WIW50_01790 [Flavobacteriaceae bacterium 3-367]|uniref:hypothetical protein n=1 Tax=Eudoraea algarum TaxID=3417568 RepID=UPI003281C8BD
MKKYLLVLAMIFAAWSCSDDDVDPTDDGPPPPPPGEASVVLNEVVYLDGEVELFNNGDINVDLTDYFLCLGPGTYRRIGDLTVTGNLDLAPGGYLVIDYDMPMAEAGLGLYVDNSDFADPGTIADFVQWGAAGSVREEVAVGAGIWTAGQFVEVSGNADYSLAFDGAGDAATDWAETTTVTLGAQNTITPPVPDVASVVLNEVGYLNDQVELYNNGTLDVDVSDYFLCLGPGTYRRIGDLTVSGDLNLSPGSFLTITYDQINTAAGQISGVNATGGLGLYLNSSDFTDPATLSDFVQWGAGGSVREPVAVAAGIWTAGEFVTVIGNSETSIAFDGEGDAASDWAETADPTFGNANSIVAPEVSVVLNEVAYLGDQVELYNNGNLTIDVSDYQLCLGPGTYRRIGDLTVSGDLALAPGAFLVATYDQINTAAGQIGGANATGGLGLYINNSDFTAESTLADFVQWGDGGSIRESVAVAAGIWTAGDFVEVIADVDNSIAFDGEGNASSDWAETTTTTFGDANTVTAPVRSVVINEVEYLVNDEIEIYNNGDVTVDLASYWLCFGPGAYFRIGDPAMTDVVSGSVNLAPGEFLVVSAVSLSAPDAAGAVGLYINNTNFADANTIRDFVQWGAAGNAREIVAVTAGIWNAGGFVPNVANGSSIAYDGEGEASTDWVEDGTPSLGSGNQVP